MPLQYEHHVSIISISTTSPASTQKGREAVGNLHFTSPSGKEDIIFASHVKNR